MKTDSQLKMNITFVLDCLRTGTLCLIEMIFCMHNYQQNARVRNPCTQVPEFFYTLSQLTNIKPGT